MRRDAKLVVVVGSRFGRRDARPRECSSDRVRKPVRVARAPSNASRRGLLSRTDYAPGRSRTRWPSGGGSWETVGRRIDTLQRDCPFHGDCRSRFLATHHGPTAGFSIPEVSIGAKLARAPAGERRRGPAASPYDPESPSRAPSRPFVYSWRSLVADAFSRRFPRLVGSSRGDFSARQLACDARSLTRVESSRSARRQPRYHAKYFSLDSSRARRARLRRSVHPCVNAKFVT